MKKLILFLLTLTVILGVLASCDNGEISDTETSAESISTDTSAQTTSAESDTETIDKSVVMRAKIIELDSKTALVEPVEEDPARRSADRIYVNIGDFSDIGARVGSIVDITYDGYIMETYPAQIRARDWNKVSDPITSEPTSRSIEVDSIDKLNEMREMSVCNDEATLKQYLQGIADSGIRDKYDLIAFVNLIDSLPNISVLDGNITRICASYGISEDTGDKTNVVFITTEAENGDWARVEYGISITDVAGKLADEKASVGENSLLSTPIKNADGKLTLHIETRQPHPSGKGTMIQWICEADGIFTRIYYYTEAESDVNTDVLFGDVRISDISK